MWIGAGINWRLWSPPLLPHFYFFGRKEGLMYVTLGPLYVEVGWAL